MKFWEEEYDKAVLLEERLSKEGMNVDDAKAKQEQDKKSIQVAKDRFWSLSASQTCSLCGGQDASAGQCPCQGWSRGAMCGHTECFALGESCGSGQSESSSLL